MQRVEWRLDMCQLIVPMVAPPMVASRAKVHRLHFHHDMIRSWDAWDTLKSMDLVWPVHLVCIAIASRGHPAVPSKVSARFLRRRFSPL